MTKRLPVHQRPTRRADCLEGGSNAARPCPYVGCRHHLYLDVHPVTGDIKLTFPGVELEDMGETCSLDIASRGEQKLEVVGAALGVTRERIRQIEAEALGKLARLLDADARPTSPPPAASRYPSRTMPRLSVRTRQRGAQTP